MRFVRTGFVVVAGMSLWTMTTQADQIFVPGDFATIQGAIDAALDGDEVIVAAGAYFEAIDFLGKAITVRSIDGPETTTIDASGLNTTVVLCVNFEGPDTLLQGFTITGGGHFSIDGGGMFVQFSSPTITDCVFVGNEARDGGGMYNSDCSSPTMINCSFNANYACFGGAGMYNRFFSSPTMINCSFNANYATVFGGGMHNISNSSPTLTNCTFSGNNGAAGGGMFNTLSSSPVLTNCEFINNIGCECEGGGMYNGSSHPILTNCVFIGNEADVAGGGMYNGNSNPILTNCTFSGNSAPHNDGGGMANANGSPTITNCTFSGNTANFSGGGMYNDGGSPTLTNCTFSGNSAANGNAIAFDFGPSNLEMTNCILWDGGDEIWNNDESTITIGYTDVQGGWDGTGNIDADPQFEDDDLRLSPGSPCIDAADNTAPGLFGITEDLDGNPRFVDDPKTKDTGNGEAPIVDMGAYEFQGIACLWDLDGDDAVGTGDLILLLGSWGDPYGTADLIELLGNWGPCPK